MSSKSIIGFSFLISIEKKSHDKKEETNTTIIVYTNDYNIAQLIITDLINIIGNCSKSGPC